MRILVGTSGWQYRDWRGPFYPQRVPQRLWLEHYAAEFGTVELDGSFYRLPTAESFAQWRRRTPDGFVMAVKASRYLTHVKRLRDPEEPVARLMDRAAGLGPALGPVLLQLPPTLRLDPSVLASLDRCLAAFPASVQVAVEPRHPSWWVDDVRSVLERRAAALCWADRRGGPVTPLWCTADWRYVRFHVGAASPAPRYGRRSLHSWAGRIVEGRPREVFAYFNNDQGGAAVHDAQALRRLLGVA
jgi:uncharacterized protein YecE (DUF72 family)